MKPSDLLQTNHGLYKAPKKGRRINTMDWEDELEWSKGQWLKGMNLSGSQAEYIISVIKAINHFQRQDLLKELRGEVEGMMKELDEGINTVVKQGERLALQDVIKLLEKYES